ncbi:MAG: ribulose-phosphate 3-epimerase, partial [Desulfobacteraceae bacterium]|nr:ribulose-phosphate 3-epimerase [Desulfobacteraceae bacterium]
IEKPDLIIPEFAKAGANLISVHAEACTHLHRSLQLIKSFDVKAGVALNPATPLSSIEWVIDQLDFVLIMSVNPGFGGQSFIQSSLQKIKNLSSMLKEKGSKAIIQVDGGVNMKTINDVSKAGATSFVAGSAIFNTKDYNETISDLRKTM